MPETSRSLPVALRVTLALSPVVCALRGTPLAHARADAACAPSWTLASMPDDGEGGSIYGVAALSSSDAWAVGSFYDGSTDTALALHWNGTAWSTLPTPRIGTAAYLNAVAPLSGSDVWGAGQWIGGSGTSLTLAEHWDGSAWTVVSTPSPGAIANYLVSLAAIAPDDVWAVGYQVTGAALYQTLALHWNGSAWSVVPTSNLGSGDNLLAGIAAVAGNDVWAVGFFEATGTTTQTLIEHWNGAMWTVVPSPNPGTTSNALSGVAAISPDDLWAVGTFHDGANNVSLAEHWDGSAWSVAASPNIPFSGNVLNDVAAVAGGDVWAVGYYYNTVGDRVYETLTMHWDGSAWTLIPSPNASATSTFSYLQDVSALPAGEVWTVGQATTGSLVEHLCAVDVLDSGFSPRNATVGCGSAVAWSIPVGDAQDHTVLDNTGMDLYDSGSRAPGSSFTYRYIAAGSYAVIDALDSRTGSIRVPVAATPASGNGGTVFTVTWSSDPAPPTFVFDVQIKRPGSTAFANWKTGQTAASSTFVPDGGTGTYAFRGRLRRTSNGRRSSWSPTASITVS